MYGTTFPDDDLRRFLQELIRNAGLLEPTHRPHSLGGTAVSVSESLALGELSDAGTMSQQDLATRLGLEKSTVSRLAAGLESRGWLTRARDDGNRRVYRLSLTDEGAAVAERVGADLRATHDLLLSRLTPQEREALTVGLGGLIRVLGELDDGRPGHHTGGPSA
ncbi:MarR family winged helix-turn-helix transcriptional regulator [Cellulomonas sp. URHD0024]|uniref:MarR family winged helix-turn-helix transcriptional regulator n=1 Tax=Cellulomonas sp. URHD0024 TaxID=1302620 RepID=UPI00040F27A2|nr:MarR family transcriptional regulator [Cellulomonas sp. URHD0024]